MNVQKNDQGDMVCEHGTAMDVHCCNCHSGFLFDASACVCRFASEAERREAAATLRMAARSARTSLQRCPDQDLHTAAHFEAACLVGAAALDAPAAREVLGDLLVQWGGRCWRHARKQTEHCFGCDERAGFVQAIEQRLAALPLPPVEVPHGH